jgi:hypothetical protein
MNRLFRQDRLIASNSIRAMFVAWYDPAIAALLLLGGLAFVRAPFVDRPWMTAAWAALAAGTMIGIAAQRLVARRLAFHAFDGLLAADALCPQMRRQYMAAWHGVALALLLPVSLIVRPSLLLVSVPAYLAGALIAGLTGSFGRSGRITLTIVGTARPKWTLRALSQRPIAGLAAAAVLLLALFPARTLGTNALMAVVGTGTLLLALMLTSVDDAIVRFMTIAGHGSRRLISEHAKGVTTFLAVSAPGCCIMLGPVAAGLAAAACAATMALMTFRILAYRLHAKRFADVLVSILAGLLMLVAYAMPIAVPVLAFAMLWQLHRRGRTKTWLLE